MGNPPSADMLCRASLPQANLLPSRLLACSLACSLPLPLLPLLPCQRPRWPHLEAQVRVPRHSGQLTRVVVPKHEPVPLVPRRIGGPACRKEHRPPGRVGVSQDGSEKRAAVAAAAVLVPRPHGDEVDIDDLAVLLVYLQQQPVPVLVTRAPAERVGACGANVCMCVCACVGGDTGSAAAGAQIVCVYTKTIWHDR